MSRRFGVDLVRVLDEESLLKRRLRLLQHHNVNLLLDVGACAGQYVLTMRGLGYRDRVVSYEPIAENFHLLERAAAHDPSWTVVRAAVGTKAGSATMHVSANAQSSSLLPMLPTHLEVDPTASYERDESVPMTTLEAILEQQVRPDDRAFLKIDTQGTEMEVLASGGNGLKGIVGLQVELSTVPLYAGQELIEEALRRIRALGFTPVSFEPDFWHEPTGRLLQLDGVFLRD